MPLKEVAILSIVTLCMVFVLVMTANYKITFTRIYSPSTITVDNPQTGKPTVVGK